MHTPAGPPDNAVHVGRRDQHREDVAQPPHQIVTEFPVVVVFDDAQQARCRTLRMITRECTREPYMCRVTHRFPVVLGVHADTGLPRIASVFASLHEAKAAGQ